MMFELKFWVLPRNCLAAMKVRQAIRTGLVRFYDFVVLFEHAPLVLGSFMHDG